MDKTFPNSTRNSSKRRKLVSIENEMLACLDFQSRLELKVNSVHKSEGIPEVGDRNIGDVPPNKDFAPSVFYNVTVDEEEAIHQDNILALIWKEIVPTVKQLEEYFSESAEGLNIRLKNWREVLEDNGLKVNREKTKYLRCDFGNGKIAHNKEVDIRTRDKI
ncbi:hypothetical protein Tco_1405429 [Tanacetum coccineum]